MNKVLQFIFLLVFNFPFISASAQPCVTSLLNEPIPTKCFEIVSVLVDACDGSNEGKNEMIRLKIGPNPLLVSTLTPGPCTPGVTVNWGAGSGSNPFLGWTNFSGTDLVKIDTINKRIKAAGNCGILIPKNKTDYIPVGANLLIITSTAYNPTAHDFSGLQDSLYVIVQIADATGNQGGHFANWSKTSSTRKLVLNSTTCSDTIIYNVNKLLDQNLSNTIAAEDGATVSYTFNGTATYTNPGCKIPIPIQTIDAGTAPASICAGNNINLNGSYSGNHCYAWRAANSNSGTFSDSLNLLTTFSISKNFSGSCKLYLIAKLNCKEYKDSVLINVLSPSDSILIQSMDTLWCQYNQIPIKAISTNKSSPTWTTLGAGKIDNPNQLQIVYTPDTLKDKGSIKFKVSQLGNCGIIEDSIVLTINSIDASFAPDKLILCKGEPAISLNPKDLNGIFSLSNGTIQQNLFNPIDTGNFIVTYITSVKGCSDTFSQALRVNGFYVDEINTINPTCFGKQNGSIAVLLSGGASPFVFQWNNLVNSLNQMQNLMAGAYQIQITDNNNCQDTVQVTLNEPAALQLSKLVQQPTCGLNNGAIQYNLTGGTLPYQLFVNNSPIFSNHQQHLGAGKFYYMVVDSHACSLSDTSVLLVSNGLEIYTQVIADTCNAFKGSVAVQIVRGNAPYSYNWVPMYAPNPSQYNLAGKSSGMVVVVDSKGCSDTALYEIPDICKNQIWISNAFFPYGPHIENNLFGPVTGFPENILSYHFRIFNRWGQQVFESIEYNNRWDGKVNGTDAATDVYFYELQVRFQNANSEDILKGNVTLLR